MSASRPSRNGISLLEVLISIGILAVGLTSVLSFIPAGHSMAKISLVTDQAAIVGANAIADLVTQGYLRVDSLFLTAPGTLKDPLIIDPFDGSAGWTALKVYPATLRENGVPYAASPLPGRNLPSAGYCFRSRDDVAFNVPESDDVDVTNAFADGSRAYKGNFSWIAMLTQAAGGPLATGEEATLTVVVFHSRDLDQSPVLLGRYENSGPFQVTWAKPGPLLEGRQNSELLRPNGICFVGSAVPAFRRISFAAVNNDDAGAYLEFDRSVATGALLYAMPDAVAVVEKTVTLEAASRYSE